MNPPAVDPFSAGHALNPHGRRSGRFCTNTHKADHLQCGWFLLFFCFPFSRVHIPGLTEGEGRRSKSVIIFHTPVAIKHFYQRITPVEHAVSFKVKQLLRCWCSSLSLHSVSIPSASHRGECVRWRQASKTMGRKEGILGCCLVKVIIFSVSFDIADLFVCLVFQLPMLSSRPKSCEVPGIKYAPPTPFPIDSII